MEFIKEYRSSIGSYACISHDPHNAGGYKVFITDEYGQIVRTRFFTTEKAAFASVRRYFKAEDNGRYKQWIADDYHCSDIWGQKQTAEDMLLELTEMMTCKDPEDYSPSPALYLDCMHEWNRLCRQYPN